MANRYWVGGTASWDGTVGTKWSATSGGAGGASVPTSADDVFFDNLSTGTVTIAAGNTGAKSITCTGFTGTIAGSATIAVSGSVTLVAGMTFTYSGQFTLDAIGTLTSAGKTLGSIFISSGGTTTLGDALTCTGTISVFSGTFNTANFNVTASDLNSSGSIARTITLGSSTVTLSSTSSPIDFTTSTNLTFNANTSQINLSGVSFTLAGGGNTFNNVSATSINLGGVDTTISGANTFANFTVALKTASNGSHQILFSSNQTITGTLTINSGGTNAASRVTLRSNTLGAQRTLTVGTLSAIDCDFRDINLAGTASGSSPTRAGDCKGNSGITFPAAKTVYWNLAAGGNWNATAWATSSGGSPNIANFPLPQDTAIIEATGLNSGTTITFNSQYNVGSIDASARTANTVTLAFPSSFTPPLYGDFKLGSGVTITGTGTISFIGRTTQNITSAGRTITFPITVQVTGTSFRLLDALTISNTVTHNSGTIDVNDFNLTCLTFTSANAIRTMAFGSTGTITVTSTAAATIWNTAFGSNLTVTGTPNVVFTSTGANNPTILMGGTAEANSLSFTFNGGSYTPVLSSGATYRNLTFLNAFTGTLPNVAMSLYGDLTISSAMTLSAGANAVSFISTNATARNITTNGKTFDFPLTFNGSGGSWSLVDNLTMGSTRTLTHTNGTINLNGKTLTVGTAYTTAAGTKNLTFNAGTLVCPAATATAFNNAAPTNFTTTAGTGTGKISMTAATAKTFVGGGSTYNCTLSNDGAGALTITGANTFTTLANGVSPTTFTFTAGTTTTLTNWSISGTAGNLVTIGSATAATHTLSKTSGAVSADYLSISYSTATGGATWNAGANSLDGGNNTGWIFAAPATNQGNFLMFFM